MGFIVISAQFPLTTDKAWAYIFTFTSAFFFKIKMKVKNFNLKNFLKKIILKNKFINIFYI